MADCSNEIELSSLAHIFLVFTWYWYNNNAGSCNTRALTTESNRIAFGYHTRKRYSVAITINYNYKYPYFISSTDCHILGATTADTLQAALASLSAAKAATQREQTASKHTTPTLYTKKWNPQTNKKKTKQGKEMEPTR